MGGAAAGRVSYHAQAGHPAGASSFAYAGELALAVVLADPSGALDAPRKRMVPYPAALAHALAAAPPRFAERAHRLLAAPGADSGQLRATLDDARRLVEKTIQAVAAR